MSNSAMFLHPFCFPEMESLLQQAVVEEIAPDAWMLQGNLGLDFFLAPPSSNIYLLRDNDLVIMFDSGLHPFYRPRILEILEKFKKDGAKTLVLLVSQGHWDHALNNDVIMESGYDNIRFLLPEPEIPIIESISHWLGDFREQQRYFDPDWATWMHLLTQFEEYARNLEAYHDDRYQAAWNAIKAANSDPSVQNICTAIKMLGERVLLDGATNLAERAEVLPVGERETMRFGDVEFMGWSIGRFFIIHDGAHSPGHLCLYDPKHKLVLSSDVTIEINPAFTDSSMEKLFHIARDFRVMAEQGFLDLAADSHRNETGFKTIMEFTGLSPLHPILLSNTARGRDECVSFFRAFEDYYRGLIDETLAAHARIGEATVPEILDELRKSENRHVKFKLALPFPSRPELLVCRVLKEHGYSLRRKDGDRILFTPPKTWAFQTA